MSPGHLLDFARRYTSAWCSQDPDSVAAFFSPQGSLRINDGAPSVGRHAITEVARSFMSTFPDMQVLIDDLVVDGSRLEYHWTLVSAAARLRISGFEEWTIGPDELIAESHGHFDAADYERHLQQG
jgi:hypothetical protein